MSLNSRLEDNKEEEEESAASSSSVDRTGFYKKDEGKTAQDWYRGRKGLVDCTSRTIREVTLRTIREVTSRTIREVTCWANDDQAEEDGPHRALSTSLKRHF